MLIKAVLFATAVLGIAGVVASPKHHSTHQTTAAVEQCCEFPPPPPDCPPNCGAPRAE